MEFYLKNIKKVLEEVATDPNEGLMQAQAKERLARYGANKLQKTKQRTAFQILVAQFKNLFAAILTSAALFSMYLGEYRDGSILLAIVVANALFGFYQEWKSENILESLTDLVKEKCYVLREGKIQEINTQDLVIGDIIKMEEGNGVPADIRLLETHSFATNDFILTGESVPKDKEASAIISKEVAVSERDNCVFMGTTVARGEAKGVVCATGMSTEIGKIASASSQIAEETSPLQKEINHLATRITYITFIIALFLFAVRLLADASVNEALIFAIGVAAAMVPEGLPAQISVALALGMDRLAAKNAVVKKLSSIETLGAATVIASDKTGTITKNQMTINRLFLNGNELIVSGTGYEPKGEVVDKQGNKIEHTNNEQANHLFLIGYLASTGTVNPPDEYHKTWYALGDPTESAFATFILKMNFELSAISHQYRQLQVFPFDSFRKRISIVRSLEEIETNEAKTIFSFVKGSLEGILQVSTQYIENDRVLEFTKTEKEKVQLLANAHAEQGLRIIALAYRQLDKKNSYTIEETENDLIYAGFVCMYDPPHEEVSNAIKEAFRAKLKLAMITGDNEITARAIAQQIGMMNEDNQFPQVINGEKLSKMSVAEITDYLNDRAVIFSRVSPDQKLQIVDLMKKNGEVVAVTGDGVNDTLSLKKADIGVAMGLNGAKVAQESANMVLLNDDFSTIVVAIREGRTIYKNLEKTILAGLTANVGELSCVLWGFVGGYWGVPIPILALQILMIDLVAEMFPLLMLTFDPPDENIMLQAPRNLNNHVLDKQGFIGVLFSGVLIGSLAYLAFLGSYLLNTHPQNHYESGLTVSYTAIIIGQFFNILHRRTDKSIFTKYLFSNPNLLKGFGLSIVCVLLIIYLPIINQYLHTAPLNGLDWCFVLGAGLVFLVVYEVKKVFKI